jgi:hypothetical protein
VAPQEADAIGLTAPIPPRLPGIRLRPGVEIRRWPSVYLTPYVLRIVRRWQLYKKGFQPFSGAVTHWPVPVIEALLLLDDEFARAEAALKGVRDG